MSDFLSVAELDELPEWSVVGYADPGPSGISPVWQKKKGVWHGTPYAAPHTPAH